MREKKEARPGVAAPEQAAESGSVCETARPSGYQSNTDGGCRQIRVADLLLCGRENAVPLRHLKALLHLPSREVRLMIWRERRQGFPILSDNSSGYFLPANEAERARFVRSMRARAGDILRTADAVEQGDGGID